MKRREFLGKFGKSLLGLWLGKDLVGLVNESDGKPLPDIDPLLNYDHSKVPTLTSKELKEQKIIIELYSNMSNDMIRNQMRYRDDDWGGYLILGRRAFNQGDYKTARKHHDRAVDLNNRSWDAWNELGMTTVNQGDINRGIYYTEVAHALAPKELDPLVNLGVYHGRLGFTTGKGFESSEKFLRKAIDLDPYDVGARKRYSELKKSGVID